MNAQQFLEFDRTYCITGILCFEFLTDASIHVSLSKYDYRTIDTSTHDGQIYYVLSIKKVMYNTTRIFIY